MYKESLGDNFQQTGGRKEEVKQQQSQNASENTLDLHYISKYL